MRDVVAGDRQVPSCWHPYTQTNSRRVVDRQGRRVSSPAIASYRTAPERCRRARTESDGPACETCHSRHQASTAMVGDASTTWLASRSERPHRSNAADRVGPAPLRPGRGGQRGDPRKTQACDHRQNRSIRIDRLTRNSLSVAGSVVPRLHWRSPLPSSLASLSSGVSDSATSDPMISDPRELRSYRCSNRRLKDRPSLLEPHLGSVIDRGAIEEPCRGTGGTFFAKADLASGQLCLFANRTGLEWADAKHPGVFGCRQRTFHARLPQRRSGLSVVGEGGDLGGSLARLTPGNCDFRNAWENSASPESARPSMPSALFSGIPNVTR